MRLSRSDRIGGARVGAPRRAVAFYRSSETRHRMTKVGFIGLGEQGKPMAVNLAKDGFDLIVHDLRREPVDELIAIGAKAANSPREVAAGSEIIEIAVVDDAQVEAVVMGDDGIIEEARPGSVIAIHDRAIFREELDKIWYREWNKE